MSEAIAKRAFDTANDLLKFSAVPFEDEPSKIFFIKAAKEFQNIGEFTIDDMPGVDLFMKMVIASFHTTVAASNRHPSFNGTDEDLAKVAFEFACEVIGASFLWDEVPSIDKGDFVGAITSLRNNEDDGILKMMMESASEASCMLEIMFRSYAKHLIYVMKTSLN
jgi:hypothetical protein